MDAPTTEKGSGVGPDWIGTRPSGRDSLADIRLLGRALKCGWPVPEDLKTSAVERMRLILREGKSAKGWVAATRCLLAMTTVELASIHAVLSIEQQTELRREIDALKAVVMGNQRPTP